MVPVVENFVKSVLISPKYRKCSASPEPIYSIFYRQLVFIDKNSFVYDYMMESMKLFKKLALACVFCVGLCGLFSLTFADGEKGKVFNKDYTGIKSIVATISTHEGPIVVELDFKAAPNTVANFVELSNSGFYNGLLFHRVINGFMIQGGDPKGNGTGGPGYTIDDEISSLVHDAGVISMANRGPNTNGSQFFITQTPQHHLDGKHTVFGRVLQGQDIVCRIEPNDPILNIKIEEKK